MKLEGSLDAFGLPDIFQLLSFTKKTGGLRLRQADVAGVVYFNSGQVTGATADITRQSLARRLIGSGVVSDADLEAALRRSAAEGTGVTKALVGSGSIDAEVVSNAALEQTFDAVFDLLRWPEGDFAFAVDDVNPDDVGVVIPAERLVAEAGQRREAFDAASAVIPSPESLLAMPVTVPDQLQLTRDDWALLALVDGRRRAHELIELTGRGSVAVLSALADLVQRGLLEVITEGSDLAATMRRRLDLLAPLEVSTPVQTAPASVPAAPTSPPSPTKPAAVPDPIRAVADLVEEPEPEVPAKAEPAPIVAKEPAVETLEMVEAVDEPKSEAGPESPRLTTIGGPHVPQNVVPTRPEPFLPPRQPEHVDEPVGAGAMASASPPAGGGFGSSAPAAPSSPSPGDRPATMTNGSFGGVNGSVAMAARPEESALIERDPTVSRSLLLRLIAGVRGL